VNWKNPFYAETKTNGSFHHRHLLKRRLWSAPLIWLGLCSAALGNYFALLQAQQVTLGWSASPDPTVVGYYLYYGTTSGIYDNKIDVGTNTTYTVSGLVEGSTNYFTATSYTPARVESSNVAQVSYVVPGILAVAAATVSRAFSQTNHTVSLVNGAGALAGSPVIQTARLSGNACAFTWNSLPNQRYQIQTTIDLDQTNWMGLGGAMIATDSTITISAPIGANARQFYRVVLLP
jgi:hypothetical protein